MASKLHQFSATVQEIDAGTAASKDAIWDEFREQHQHQNTQKSQ